MTSFLGCNPRQARRGAALFSSPCIVFLCAAMAPAHALADEPPGYGAGAAPTKPLQDPRRIEGSGDVDVDADPIVVVPRRRQERALEAGGSVEGVSAGKAREMGARSVPEMLEETPGVSVQSTNRGAAAPILRGLIGPSNLLVVDGLRYHQSTWRTGPNQALSTLPPSAFSGIEVLLGPASTVYGSSAMGGVIAALPLAMPRSDGVSGLATLRLTSQDLASEVWGHIAYRRGALAIVAGGGYHNFGELTLGGGDKAPISAYSQAGFFGRARYDLTRDTSVGLSLIGSRIYGAGRADQLAKGDLRFYDNADEMVWADVTHHGHGAIESLRVAVAVHRSDEASERTRCKIGDAGTLAEPGADVNACAAGAQRLRDDPDVNPDAVVTRQNLSDDKVLTTGGAILANLRPLGGALRQRLRLSVGGEGWSDLVTASTSSERRTDKDWTWKDAARGSFSDGSRWTEVGAYALAEIMALRIGGARLLVDVGGRAAHFRADADGVPGLGAIHYAATGFVGTGGLRLVGDTAMGYLSLSQGFRAPNLQETTTLGDTGSSFDVPNDALTPERSNTLELGTRIQMPALEFHTAVWASMLTDAIDSREVPTDEWATFGLDAATVGTKPVRQRINKDEGLLYGAQVKATGRVATSFRPWLALGYTHGDLTLADGTTEPYRRIPPLAGSGGLRYEQQRWSVGVVSRFAMAQDRLAPGDEGDLRICADPANPGKTLKDAGKPCSGTPGWLDLGLRGGYRFTDGLRVDLVARNLLDSRYRTHGSGVDAPGRGGSVAVSGRF